MLYSTLALIAQGIAVGFFISISGVSMPIGLTFILVNSALVIAYGLFRAGESQ